MEAIAGQLYCEAHLAAELAGGEIGFAVMVRKTPPEDEKEEGKGDHGKS